MIPCPRSPPLVRADSQPFVIKTWCAEDGGRAVPRPPSSARPRRRMASALPHRPLRRRRPRGRFDLHRAQSRVDPGGRPGRRACRAASGGRSPGWPSGGRDLSTVATFYFRWAVAGDFTRPCGVFTGAPARGARGRPRGHGAHPARQGFARHAPEGSPTLAAFGGLGGRAQPIAVEWPPKNSPPPPPLLGQRLCWADATVFPAACRVRSRRLRTPLRKAVEAAIRTWCISAPIMSISFRRTPRPSRFPPVAHHAVCGRGHRLRPSSRVGKGSGASTGKAP